MNLTTAPAPNGLPVNPSHPNHAFLLENVTLLPLNAHRIIVEARFVLAENRAVT